MLKQLSMIAAALALAAAAPFAAAADAGVPGLAELKRLSARFAPVDLVVDLSALPAGERASLAKQVAAAKVMDALFLRQEWAGNETLLLELLADRSELGRARLENFLQNRGPWDRVEQDRPFVAGVPAKPEGANFYPADARKEDIEKWIGSLPGPMAEDARGFFHTIRRLPDGALALIPYSIEYQGELTQAAALLREAATLTGQPTLKKFLETRAAAFLSNDYYASDVAWMELDATLEPTIGPYEVYEDGWFNYKAAYEAFITVRDAAETEKLAKFSGQLQELEDHLPIDAALRNPKLGALAPIAVVNEVFCSGDANHGVQTAAYNLPNDERVTAEKGSKRVMLRNVQQAKFDKVLRPISGVALAKADRKRVQFDAFFTHILMHELMHGLGPHSLRLGGQETTVRQALKEVSGAFEEAKADISGLWALQYLVDKGVIDKAMQDTMYDTFLASAFRTLRFGIGEAHGKGMAMQLNWLLDQGGVKVNADGSFAVVHDKIRAAVTGLTTEIMSIQARGDYAAAKAMLERLAVIRPEAQRVIAKLTKVPIDIAPRFVTAEKLLQEMRAQ
ncbi:MAG TPA: hypothetical protein VM074_12500 [Solimonas sp.]|nr:hypothetical protein [Solimonas sp.]